MSRSSKNRKKNMRHAKKDSTEYQEKARLKLNKQVNRKMEKRFLVGIYDSFRKEGKYNINLVSHDAKLIGTFSTEPFYTMYDLGVDDCIIVKNGEHSVRMEVWGVSDKVLDILQKNYSYYEELKDEDNIYLKSEIISPFGRITIFTYNESFDNSIQITSGDWMEYQIQQKAKGKVTTYNRNMFTTNPMKDAMDKTFEPVDKEFMD